MAPGLAAGHGKGAKTVLDGTQHPTARRLRVFLCHSSADKKLVRAIHERLAADGFEPWLDESEILPGQQWRNEIARAVRNSDVIVVLLSRGSVTKSGYVNKEIVLALDVADEQRKAPFS